MGKTLNIVIDGYRRFAASYEQQYKEIIKNLTRGGQAPKIMVVGCSDSRVDPALMFHCDPGDLFVTRNVGNVVPPFANDHLIHGVSAALEFGICQLNVDHLIILGHSQCGAIYARLHPDRLGANDFLSNWLALIDTNGHTDGDACAKHALTQYYENCLEFPWIAEKVKAGSLHIHLWFFDLKDAMIYAYDFKDEQYHPL